MKNKKKDLTPLQKANLLKELKKDIKKGVGKRCKDYNYACWTCSVWEAFDIICDFYEV